MNVFDSPIWRFACSGTLLGLYGVAELLSRRAGSGGDRAVAAPRWLRPASWIAIGAFYLAIEPTGRSLANGLGNLAGIAIALFATTLRYALRRGVPGLRHPTTAVRMLFYAALPLAVGVPFGWALLTVPALAMSVYCSVREDRILSHQLGEPYREWMAASRRWIPGVW